MSFFKSWAFWFLVGIFIGCIIGYFVATLCFISAQASRFEEKMEQSLMKGKTIAEINLGWDDTVMMASLSIPRLRVNLEFTFKRRMVKCY